MRDLVRQRPAHFFVQALAVERGNANAAVVLASAPLGCLGALCGRRRGSARWPPRARRHDSPVRPPRARTRDPAPPPCPGPYLPSPPKIRSEATRATPPERSVGLIVFRFFLDLLVEPLQILVGLLVERFTPIFQSLSGIVIAPGRDSGQHHQAWIFVGSQLGFQHFQSFAGLARLDQVGGLRRYFVESSARNSFAGGCRAAAGCGTIPSPGSCPATRRRAGPGRSPPARQSTSPRDSLRWSCRPTRLRLYSRRSRRRPGVADGDRSPCFQCCDGSESA